MCGITGIHFKNHLEDTQDIKLMTDAIAHRGPDGEGYAAINLSSRAINELSGEKTPVNLPAIDGFGKNANLYLSHRRLSIIDHSTASHQPMLNGRKDLCITYNGEIYNYKTIRNELTEYDFKSNTDTEVIINAYDKWSFDCLKRFNGMWSFVIYDSKKNILFGSRDRFGIKPFYYTFNSEIFAFSSEIKGLLAKKEIPRKLNKGTSSAYLYNGISYFEEETFFDSVLELPPSCFFIYNLEKNELLITKYYQLYYNNKWETFNEKKNQEYIHTVKEKVLNSIDLRLNADVTAGTCLSGGIDSSAIVCSINKLLSEKSYYSIGTKQAVVTACYEDSPIDESKWAKLIVDHVSSQWHRVYPKKEELENDLSDLIYTQDIPFGSTSIYAQYRVMKTAKEAGITVMLDGQGGDELFTGYTPYYNMLYHEALKNLDFTFLKNENSFFYNTPLNKKMILSLPLTLVKNIIPSSLKSLVKYIFFKPDILSNYIIIKNEPFKNYKNNTLNQMLHNLMMYTSLPMLLKFEDRNSMRFGIESRTPFADDIDLIEYVFSIPSSYKIHNGWSKYLLREAMHGIIPEEIKTRKDKIGFATPEYEWLKTIKPFVFDNISQDLQKIMDIPKLEKDWDFIFSKQNKTGITDIWRIINFILWYKMFNVSL